MIISHINPLNRELQSNEDHCKGVAEFASEFAAEFGFAGWGRVMGLLHDKGKEQFDFQQYIQQVSGYKPELKLKNSHPAHAYVGALIAKKLYAHAFPFLCNPIMGHHAGLYDFMDLEEKLKEQIPSDVSVEEVDIPLQVPVGFTPGKNDFHHLVRLLFSCLVDADFLDTESFMNKDHAQLRTHKQSLELLKSKLDDYLFLLKSSAEANPVNKIRAEVQSECIKASVMSPGFFSLTVPTGGGKTLSSLVWALCHALKHGKKRIIIAIPYTSIIVQTAETLRHIFGDENVLEHHSNTLPERHEDPNVSLRMKLATENWDYPIVVTTNVQLFESMFSNKPSSCRKLHNLCNSVLILDEVQTLPLEYLQPIVDSLNTYQKRFGLSVLLTTASQPVLTGQRQGCNPQVLLKGIEHITEIIPGSFQLHDKLRRVQLHFDEAASTYDEIADRLSRYDKVLCVVNTRKDAQELYSRLPEGDLTLHLSRMMCAEHIRETIKTIKDALKSECHSVIRVISTQLIEAGVDIDFPIVFRQEAGLDSVLQAAGRCNREGKLGMSDAYVFSLERERALPKGYISQANNARKNLQITLSTDCFSPEIMTRYFVNLYSRANTFDKATIVDLLCKPCDFCFETAAKKFKLIEDDGISLIVNWKESAELVHRLETEGPNYGLMKRISQYTVNLRRNDFDQLRKSGLIKEVIEGIYWLPDREQYNKQVGLITENHWLDEILTI